MQESSRYEAEKLVIELRECDGITRPSIAQQLEDLGQASIAPLLPALDDPNWAVRYWATRVLESIGDQEALTAFKKRVWIEEDDAVRMAIRVAKTSLGSRLAASRSHVVGLPVGPDSLAQNRHQLLPHANNENFTQSVQDALIPPYSRQQLGRHQFRQADSGDWILALRPYYAALFTLQQPAIMEKSHTGWRISYKGDDQYAYFAELSEHDVMSVKAFLTAYERLVVIGINKHIQPFFTDELDACIALDFNMTAADRSKTDIGQLEYQAKYHHSFEARERLAEELTDAFAWMPAVPPVHVTEGTCITYIPAEPSKRSHLPRSLAHSVAKNLAQRHTTLGENCLVDASLCGPKASLKNTAFEHKMEEWQRLIENAEISLSRSVKGCGVCVIDDLYQSGSTLWSYARFLKNLGAQQVFGLVCVKSLRDTDNSNGGDSI